MKNDKYGTVITNEANGGREETGQILTPMIRDRNLQVLDRSGILENVGQIGCHIDHVLFFMNMKNKN